MAVGAASDTDPQLLRGIGRAGAGLVHHFGASPPNFWPPPQNPFTATVSGLRSGLAGIEETARFHGFELAARVTYRPTDTDFSTQATALKDSGVKYVFMATQSRFTGKIVGACANIGFLPDFVGNYFSFNPQIIADNPVLKPLFEKHWKTSGPYAHWGEDVPGMKRMLEAVGRYAPDQKPDPFFVQGWSKRRSSARS